MLYTDKTRTSALFKSLSLRFKGRLAFAEVNSKAADVVESQGINQFPKLVVMKTEGAEEYSGGPRVCAERRPFRKHDSTEAKVVMKTRPALSQLETPGVRALSITA